MDAWDHQDKRGDDWVKEAVKAGLTREMIDSIKWEAFWDAPLYIEGSGERPPTPLDVDSADERPVRPARAAAQARRGHARDSDVRGAGLRGEDQRRAARDQFPGRDAGVFAGRLQYDVFKGSNLIRQVLIAKTEQPSVAFKYDGGLKGLPIQPASRVVWRDLADRWQDHRFGGPINQDPATVWSSNRLIAAELAGRVDRGVPAAAQFLLGARIRIRSSATTGIARTATRRSRSASGRPRRKRTRNSSTTSRCTARGPAPGSRCRCSSTSARSPAQAAVEAALTFTHGDRFKPLPGYQVMGSITITWAWCRGCSESGSLDNRLNDVESAKAVGINIYGIIDGAAVRPAARHTWQAQAEYYDAARRQSDKNFLVMPNMENHRRRSRWPHDLMISKPMFWLTEARAGPAARRTASQVRKGLPPGQSGGPVEMTRLENALIFMPHPRSKGSTGFPDAVKDTRTSSTRPIEGSGIAGAWASTAPRRGCASIRCLGLFDEMNNWYVGSAHAAKYMQAISEARSDIGDRGKPPYDETYANVAGQLREARSAADRSTT